MKKLLIAVLLALNSCSITEPTVTSVAFRLDLGCNPPIVGAQDFSFAVDDSIIGGEKLSAGQTSRFFPVSVGTHQVSADIPTLSFFFTWESLTLTFNPGDRIIYLLRCTP